MLGWAFLVVGTLDVALVWYPAAFGNSGWEFGSVTAMLNGFPLPVMAAGLLLGSGIVRDNRAAAMSAIVIAVIFGVACIGAALLYALSVPVALKSVTDSMARQGLLKAVARSVVQLVTYPTILLWVVVRGLKLVRS